MGSLFRSVRAPLSGLTQLFSLNLDSNQVIDGAALSGLEPLCKICR